MKTQLRRFSIDKLIRSKKKPVFHLPVKTVTACLLVFACTQGSAQTVQGDDFKHLEGKWKGQLTYLDYSSNKEAAIKANASVEVKNDHLFILAIDYPDEPSYNGKDTYRIKENGTLINDKRVIEKTRQADGTLKIVLESKGPDGNDHKPATFHHELLIGRNVFIMTKRVKFDGESAFFQRNQYAFSR